MTNEHPKIISHRLADFFKLSFAIFVVAVLKKYPLPLDLSNGKQIV